MVSRTNSMHTSHGVIFFPLVVTALGPIREKQTICAITNLTRAIIFKDAFSGYLVLHGWSIFKHVLLSSFSERTLMLVILTSCLVLETPAFYSGVWWAFCFSFLFNACHSLVSTCSNWQVGIPLSFRAAVQSRSKSEMKLSVNSGVHLFFLLFLI